MKIARVERLIDDGEFSNSEEWATINGHIQRAIEAVEWPEGSGHFISHRAINKMSLGTMHGVLVGGVLILPTRSMYRYLTDRVGNFEELAPYFPLWKALSLRSGLLAVIAVEHDGTSREVPRIPKGTDGRALQ